MTFFRKMFTSSRLTTSECYIEVKQKGGGHPLATSLI